MSDSQTITLSLISHTNIGKTTLTRTLLRRDVGEVRDAPHVTEESSRYVMWEGAGDKLVIWDTPGFGNVRGLLKRLQQEGGTVGWVMHEVVDRMLNRPLYSSLEAARNVRAQSDVVLYLVNAREMPEDAGYVEGELTLLDALAKPVLMLINQADLAAGNLDGQDLERRWWRHFEHHVCLKGTLLLDAFTRSWLQELRLVDMVKPLLNKDRQVALSRLRGRFVLEQRNLFEACTRHAAETLWFAAHQVVKRDRKDTPAEEIFRGLLDQLQLHLDNYLDLLVDRHGIQSAGRARLKADIEQVTGLANKPVDEQKTGLMAGAVAGAGTGLMADIMAGGLTLGGGTLVGFLGGYLGGISYARVSNFLMGGASVAWRGEALEAIYRLLLSYYLVAALHGRGKGRLEVEEVAPFIASGVERQMPDAREILAPLLREATRTDDEERWKQRFQEVFKNSVLTVLEELFPSMSENLRGEDF